MYNPQVLPILVCWTLAAAGLGDFTQTADIGMPVLEGAAVHDPATGEYKVTGAGADIWGRADQFRYVWREASTDFTLAANIRFLSGGNGHRKASLMLRQTSAADAPFLHLALHGDGLISVQFRNSAADTVNTVDFPIESAGEWRLKLARRGRTITVFAAKGSAPLRELGHTFITLSNPLLAGLAVSSHDKDASCTVVFSNVVWEVVK